MSVVDCGQLIFEGESQHCEFKETLSGGAQEEAIECLVAFANTTGGNVLFGVTDTGREVGVSVGSKTIEDIGNRITQQTYPSLPHWIYVEEVESKTIVRVEAYADIPPLSGAYLKSSIRIDPDKPVSVDSLRAFRRVGRTNQAVDYMLLHRTVGAAPNLVLRQIGGGTRGTSFPVEWPFEVSNSGPGWLYGITLSVSHPNVQFNKIGGEADLPPPEEERRALPNRRQEVLRPSDATADPGNTPVRLSATYFTPDGLRWRTTVELTPRSDGYSLGRRMTRIAEFPAKREWADDVREGS